MEFPRMNSIASPALLLLAVSFVSCAAKHPPRIADGCYTIAPRLSETWSTLQDARSGPNGCAPDAEGRERCEALRFEIEGLAQACPNHPPALFAGAILAYEDRNLIKSQQLLDSLLALNSPHPEAAALRARIAIEQGNVPFALRFLEQQVRITGDNAGLREAHASALFLAHRSDEAREELDIAEALGAPKHRIAFHRGLIHESEGRRDMAAKEYESALLAKPGWAVADSRLKALRARR